MAVQFKPKPGKPHIKIFEECNRHFLWVAFYLPSDLRQKATQYCNAVNPDVYLSAGEAARALHYGGANK